MKRSRIAAAIVFGALAACSAASDVGSSAGAPNDETIDGGASGSDGATDAHVDAHDGSSTHDADAAHDASTATDADAANDGHVADASDAASDADASAPVASVRKKYLDYSVLLGGPVRTPSAAFVKAHLADVEKRRHVAFVEPDLLGSRSTSRWRSTSSAGVRRKTRWLSARVGQGRELDRRRRYAVLRDPVETLRALRKST